MGKMAILVELADEPGCVGWRTSGPGRVLIGDMLGGGSLDLAPFFVKITPPVRPHYPVRIQKRKLGMLRHRVDVSLCQICPLFTYLPVFSSEVQVAVFSS